MKKVIGITGGVGTGKSTVLKMLADLGAQTLSADDIGHRILEKGTLAYKSVVERFDTKVLDQDASISRKKLASIVFFDDNAREDLERITHPFIIEEIRSNIEGFKKKQLAGNNMLAVEIPLLYECGLENIVDEVLLIVAEQEAQLYRQTTSRGVSREEARGRIKAQIPLDIKIKRADHVILNNGSMDDLLESVRRFWAEIFLP